MTEKLSQEYSLSKTIATHCAKNILRYREIHGKNPSEAQVKQIINIEKMLEKRGNYLTLNESTRNDQAYLHRKEADLMFWKVAARDSLEISVGLNSATHQTKYFLKNIKIQIGQDISQLHHRKDIIL